MKYYPPCCQIVRYKGGGNNYFTSDSPHDFLLSEVKYYPPLLSDRPVQGGGNISRGGVMFKGIRNNDRYMFFDESLAEELWNRIIHYKFAVWKLMTFLLVCLALSIFSFVRAII